MTIHWFCANGAERNILAGAQRLLKNGRICSVLMHARKAKRGRRPILEDPAPGNVSRYAYELMMWLEEGHLVKAVGEGETSREKKDSLRSGV
eukprot:g13795.t1